MLGLAQVKGDAVVESLVRKLQDTSLDKRLKAADTVAKLPSKAMLQGHACVLRLVEDGECDPFARRTALRMLGKLPSAVLARILGTVVPRLEDEDGDARRAALELLRKAGEEAVAPHAEFLISLVARAERPWPVRITGLYALALAPPAVLASQLDIALLCLDDEQPDVRWAALDVVREGAAQGRLSLTVQQVGMVVERLWDPEVWVRWGAINALAALPPAAAAGAPLARVLQALGAGEVVVRVAGITALSRLVQGGGVAGVVSALVGTLDDKEPGVRWAAIQALTRLPEKALLGQQELLRIGRCLHDQDAYVRDAAGSLFAKVPESGLPQEVREALAAKHAADAMEEDVAA